MRIVCVGGGPAGLYFALLSKKRHPDTEVIVYERNRADDTFGFGVVFSDQTLEGLELVDAESYQAIIDAFFRWDAIDIHVHGEVLTSVGHGFSGLSRAALLAILQKRAAELGVVLQFETEIQPQDPRLLGADLIVACDGIQSEFRDQHQAAFSPELEFRKSRFVWLGTTYPFDAFTFYFNQHSAGLFQVHAYRYEEGRSTFIVECSEETFQRSGLDEHDEQATARFLEEVFSKELRGHPLLTNRSIWRRFPVVRNGCWHHDNVVLLGDSAHSAHFSIGSGTKLALEDAVILRDALDKSPSLQEGLVRYDRERRPGVLSLQRAAQVSLEWFEETERHIKKDALAFSFALLTRSLRVTHENLQLRDPELVKKVDDRFERDAERLLGAALPPRPDKKLEPRPPMFVPLKLRDLVLPNRVGVSSMCMYSATDGSVDDFHLVHLGSRAIGGAGLIMTEMTDISAEARITPGCAGLYTSAHVAAFQRVTGFVHQHSPAKIGIQLAHAGRKGSTLPPWQGQDLPLKEDGWELLAPSALPFWPYSDTPREMQPADFEKVLADFERSTDLAEESGFDLIELHCAHGYLLAQFLSPLTNQRTDEYGGSVQNRLRFPLQVFRAMRARFPQHKPMFVRLSASDWKDGGLSRQDLLVVAQAFKDAGADLLDISSGGTVSDQAPEYGRLFQVPFAELVKSEIGIPTAAVGNISSYTDVNGVLAARRADLCLIARAHLFDPYWVRHAATAQGYELSWPAPYGILRGYSPRFS